MNLDIKYKTIDSVIPLQLEPKQILHATLTMRQNRSNVFAFSRSQFVLEIQLCLNNDEILRHIKSDNTNGHDK